MKEPVMSNLLFVMSIILSSNMCWMDEQPLPKDVRPILLPTIPVLVEPEVLPDTPPKPTPTPQLVATVKSDEWYLIETIDKSIILDSPEGIVKITEYDVSSHPYSFVGRLSDGTGDPDEVRTCPTNQGYKYVYSVRALSTGNVELQIGKSGSVTRDGFQRVKLKAVKATIKPPPTPIDPIPVDPIPVDPTPTPIPTGIRVLLLYELNASMDKLRVVQSPTIEKWMTDNCAKDPDGRPGWRRWDNSSISATGVDNESEIWKKLWEKTKPQITDSNMVFVVTDTKIYGKPTVSVDDTLKYLNDIKEGKF